MSELNQEVGTQRFPGDVLRCSELHWRENLQTRLSVCLQNVKRNQAAPSAKTPSLFPLLFKDRTKKMDSCQSFVTSVNCFLSLSIMSSSPAACGMSKRHSTLPVAGAPAKRPNTRSGTCKPTTPIAITQPDKVEWEAVAVEKRAKAKEMDKGKKH